MRRWTDSTFVSVSANAEHEPGGAEERWIPVMQALSEKGATVRFLALPQSPMGEWARGHGIAVDPYILDKWNMVRSRSRLRKYLRRFDPVAAHSTGLEADLVLRWAARKVPSVEVVHTVCCGAPQATRRRRPTDALMRRFDELGMRSAAAVFVDDEEIAREVSAARVPAERVVLDPPGADRRASVRAHLEVYRRLMAAKGAAG